MTDSNGAPRRLSQDQKQLWDEVRPHVPSGVGRQGTAQQRVNLFVAQFVFWCDFEGVGSTPPSAEAIKAEFEAAGASELCPDSAYLEEICGDPASLWLFAPGGAASQMRRGEG